MGGFAEETEAQDIHAAFAPFGDIVDLQLPPDSSEGTFLRLPLCARAPRAATPPLALFRWWLD